MLQCWCEMAKTLSEHWIHHRFDFCVYQFYCRQTSLLLLQVAVVLVYVVVIAAGVCGNSVVIKIVIQHQRLHASYSAFISCLVVSDFVLCTFSLPVQLHYQLTNHWVRLSAYSASVRYCYIVNY